MHFILYVCPRLLSINYRFIYPRKIAPDAHRREGLSILNHQIPNAHLSRSHLNVASIKEQRPELLCICSRIQFCPKTPCESSLVKVPVHFLAFHYDHIPF